MPVLSHLKRMAGSHPELIERGAQEFVLFGRVLHERYLLLAAQGIVEVDVDSLELGGPGGERVRLARIEHVAHGQSERVQVVLHAKQLQGILPAAVGKIALQLPQAPDLQDDVGRVGHHGHQR